MRHRNHAGFTLIEILIALAIFSILAMITASALKNAFHSKAILFKETESLNQLQLAITLLSHDIQHATNRPIRAEEGHLFPPFIGQPKRYIEFTYHGSQNISLKNKHSHLLRIGYLCEHGTLIRRLFYTVDRLNSQDFQDEILLSHLKTCRFAYLNAPLQVLPVWRGFAIKQNQQAEPLPKAVQLTLTLQGWGTMVSLFPIVEAVYRAS